MGIFQGLNFLRIDIGLVIIEGIIISFLIFLILYALKGNIYRYSKKESQILDSLKQWIEKGEVLCEELIKMAPSKEGKVERILDSEKLKSFDSSEKKVSSTVQFFGYKDFHDKREVQILKMADAGYDIFEIAKSLGLSPGEIRFLLNWMKYRKSFKQIVSR